MILSAPKASRNGSGIEQVKQAARGREVELLSSVAGIDADLLDGNGHPCPKCGGTNRFALRDRDRGAVGCRKCFHEGSGDFIAATAWHHGISTGDAIRRLAEYLHIGNGKQREQQQTRKIAATFDYTDDAGELLYQVVRYEPKDFRQRKPDGAGGWVYKLGDVRRVPYRLPELIAAPAGEPIVICEGEKAAEAARAIGMVATTSAGGAKNAKQTDWTPLAGRAVTILPDNDSDGEKYAADVAAILRQSTPPELVRVVRLPGLPPKGDVVDYIEAQRIEGREDIGIVRAIVDMSKAAQQQEQQTAQEQPSPEQEQPSPEQPPQPERITYRSYTAAELDALEITTEYLIERTLVAGQPCIIAGPKKALKTSIMLDMALSLATGGFFLGKLRCTRPARVAVMSGESGIGTIQETLRRIANAAGHHLADVDNLIVSDELPKFGHLQHVEAIGDFIQAKEIEVLCIDPAYLCMPGGDAGNLFIQGEILRSMNDICEPLGVTLVLCHHTRKNVADPFQPPELEDMAWAGFQEWARQWLLLGRRERYEPGTGDHRLWLSAGGSAGHSALWALDISEGVYDGTTARYWQVGMTTASEARNDVAERCEQRKQQKRDEQLDRDVTALVRAASKYPAGETSSVLRGVAGLNSSRVAIALSEAISRGEIVACEVVKASRKTPYDGFKLAGGEE